MLVSYALGLWTMTCTEDEKSYFYLALIYSKVGVGMREDGLGSPDIPLDVHSEAVHVKNMNNCKL